MYKVLEPMQNVEKSYVRHFQEEKEMFMEISCLLTPKVEKELLQFASGEKYSGLLRNSKKLGVQKSKPSDFQSHSTSQNIDFYLSQKRDSRVRMNKPQNQIKLEQKNAEYKFRKETSDKKNVEVTRYYQTEKKNASQQPKTLQTEKVQFQKSFCQTKLPKINEKRIAENQFTPDYARQKSSHVNKQSYTQNFSPLKSNQNFEKRGSQVQAIHQSSLQEPNFTLSMVKVRSTPAEDTGAKDIFYKGPQAYSTASTNTNSSKLSPSVKLRDPSAHLKANIEAYRIKKQLQNQQNYRIQAKQNQLFKRR